MFLFLTGVSCVGKTTAGRIIAKKLGIEYHSVDYHVELYYGKSIERIINECIGPSGYNYKYAEALAALLKSLAMTPSVIELPPSGLMYKSWLVVKKAEGITVALHDKPENILNRLIFTDIDSKPIDVTLNDREKKHYLTEIREDISYFNTGYKKADFQIDVSGLLPEQVADQIIAITRFDEKVKNMFAQPPTETKECVLYYGLKSPQQEFLLRRLLSGLGLRWKKISRSDLTSTIGSLADLEDAARAGREADLAGQEIGLADQDRGINGHEADPANIPDESIVLFSQLPDGQISLLLDKIRQTKGLQIDLKAVVTEHNRSWSFLDLAGELRREHTFMRQFTALRGLVSQAEARLAQGETNPELSEAVAQAKRQLAAAQGQEEIDLRQFSAAGKKLAELLRP